MKHRVSYNALSSAAPEEIEARSYRQDGDWFLFEDGHGVVARIRAAQVDRIDRIGTPDPTEFETDL